MGSPAGGFCSASPPSPVETQLPGGRKPKAPLVEALLAINGRLIIQTLGDKRKREMSSLIF